MMESISPQMNTHGNTHVPVELLEKAVLSSIYGYGINDCRQKDNPIIFVNNAFLEITGYEAKNVLSVYRGGVELQNKRHSVYTEISNEAKCMVWLTKRLPECSTLPFTP